MFLFFFKQKTAYEMRISDWSSDVCSSDLIGFGRRQPAAAIGLGPIGDGPAARAHRVHPLFLRRRELGLVAPAPTHITFGAHRFAHLGRAIRLQPCAGVGAELIEIGHGILNSSCQRRLARSEEHTSELQSLMRISYAVFCL